MKKDVQLNALLCQAVTAEEIDFPLVEKLLKAGADPIGRCSEEDEDENAFGEALVNAQGNGNDYYSVDLKWAAQLPKLFLSEVRISYFSKGWRHEQSTADGSQ